LPQNTAAKNAPPKGRSDKKRDVLPEKNDINRNKTEEGGGKGIRRRLTALAPFLAFSMINGFNGLGVMKNPSFVKYVLSISQHIWKMLSQ
jgi:hypothetical protein